MVDTIAALCHPKVVHIHLPVGCSQYSQQQLAVSGAGSDEWRHMPASWFLTAHRWLDKAVLRKCSFIRDKMHAFSFHFIKIRNIASNMGDIEVLNNTATCSSENRSAGHETAMLPDKRDFSRVSWRTITRGGREQLAPWRLCDETSRHCAEQRCVQHPLSFVHIPKAAGSFVTNVAYMQAGLLWGVHYCRHLAWPSRTLEGTKGKRPAICRWGEICFIERSDGCDLWHVPPRWVPWDDPRPQSRAPFRACIVRDPLMRLLSEYTYRLSQNDPSALQSVLRHIHHHPDEDTPGCATLARGFLDFYASAKATIAPFAYDCHLVPQVCAG